MEELGEFSGFLIIGSMALLSSRYVLKFIFQKFNTKLDDKTKALLVKVMTLNKQLHPYISYAALLFIMIHVYLVTGFNLRFDFRELTGLATTILIVLNIVVGILGQYVFKKPRPQWFKPMHRLLTLISIFIIILHID